VGPDGRRPPLLSATAAAAAATCLCITADNSPAQLRGNHVAKSNDVEDNDDDDDDGRTGASAGGRGSDGGENSTAGGGGGRNDGVALYGTFDPQRSSGVGGSRLPVDRATGRQSFSDG